MPVEKKAPPLFRPEAMGEPEYGEAFAFSAPGWRPLGLLILLAAALILPFGLLANFDRVAQAPGILVPAQGIARLAAQQAGVVTKVLVTQGASVKQGEPILKIAANTILPGGTAAPAQMLATYRQQQQFAAEDLDAEKLRASAERQRLDEQVEQLSASIRSAEARITIQHQRITTNEKRLKNLAGLRAKGYVSDVTYQAQEEAVLTLRQQLAALEQEVATARHELRRAWLQRDELAAQQRQAVLRSAAAQAELERGAAAAQAEAEVIAAAPIAGTLAALNVAPGAVVAAGEQVAIIAPAGGRLEALLFVPPAAAGTLAVGQEVTIRYDAFPWLRYGLGRGIVTAVATAAAAGDGQSGLLQSYGAGGAADAGYRVRVKLTEQPPGISYAALRPDMRIAASIVIERRSLLDWLFTPLWQRWRESRRAGVPSR